MRTAAVLVSAFLVLIASSAPASAAAPMYNLEGTWHSGPLTNGVRGPVNGVQRVAHMNMITGAFSGTSEVEGVKFVLAGVESGRSVTYTQSEGSYTAHDVIPELSVLPDGHIGGNGEFEAGQFWMEVVTRPPSAGNEAGQREATETPTPMSETSTLCLPADCRGVIATVPEELSDEESSIALELGCGASVSSEEPAAEQLAVSAETSVCHDAFLQHLRVMVRVEYSQYQNADAEPLYSRKDLRMILQALKDLQESDQSSSVQNDARHLDSNPTLAPSPATTKEVEALVQALGQDALGDPNDPGLIEADEALAKAFTDASTASVLAGARSAGDQGLQAGAALAALTKARPSAADGRAFTQAISQATMTQASATRGAARLTLALGLMLATDTGDSTSSPRTPSLVGRASKRLPRRGKRRVLVQPTGAGARTLRELQIAGLSRPVYVSVQLIELGGPTVHRASRSIRIR